MVSSIIVSLWPTRYQGVATFEKRLLKQIVEHGDQTSSQLPKIFLTAEQEKIKSRDSLLEVVGALSLQKKWKTDQHSAMKRLEKMIRIEIDQEAGSFRIRAEAATREDASDIANELVRIYMRAGENVGTKDTGENMVERGDTAKRLREGIEKRLENLQPGEERDFEEKRLEKIQQNLIAAETGAASVVTYLNRSKAPKVTTFEVQPNLVLIFGLGFIFGPLTIPLIGFAVAGTRLDPLTLFYGKDHN